jgi:hypothetical protein
MHSFTHSFTIVVFITQNLVFLEPKPKPKPKAFAVRASSRLLGGGCVVVVVVVVVACMHE